MKDATGMFNRLLLTKIIYVFFVIYSRKISTVKPKIWLASGWLAALILPSGAFAALGANVSSIETDKTQIKAAIRMASANSKYTIHELQTPAGTVIREYVTPAGKIFAVAWQGPFMPDLKQLLGTYFDEYNNAAKENHAGHNRLGIRRPGLVVYSSGHMSAFSGKAYVPQMLPQGVTVDEIQ